jgi:hypothetical protein
MITKTPPAAMPLPARLGPGDVLAIETPQGTRHVQITHIRAPYPDVLRAITPNGATDASAVAKGSTAFVAMVELGRALADGAVGIQFIGHASLPAADRAFPTFRLPIRDKAGNIVYWWAWDGEGLTVSPEAANSSLPIREILPFDSLRQRLAGLG